MYEELVKRLREHGEFLIVSDRMKAPPNVNVRNVFAEDYYQAADAIEELNRDLDIAIRAEAAATEACKPRWISVEERLPEKAEQIADHWFSAEVIGKDEVTIRKAYYNFTAGVWLDANCEMEWDSITHWMPTPPKEETE